MFDRLADVAGRLWQRVANEPAVLIALVIVGLRAAGRTSTPTR